MENKDSKVPDSYYRLTSVLVYFCIAYGILLGMIFTFGLENRAITGQLALQNTQSNADNLSADAQETLESNGIFVSSLKPFDEVTSPLNVSGFVTKAAFPNNTFSAILVDNTGQILAISEVHTEDEGQVVNFQTSMEFGTARDEEGNIFFEDVHQTGEEETEIKSYKLPVKFAYSEPAPETEENEADTEANTQEADVAGAETEENSEETTEE